MNLVRSAISFWVLLLLSLYARGQDTTYVYQDSAIMYADTVVKVDAPIAEDDAAYNDATENIVYRDTSLLKNQLAVHPDSIAALKRLDAFAYGKNLDSLLHEYQRSLEVEEPKQANTSWLEAFFSSRITEYFFWLLGGAFICFILYKLFFTTGFFQRSYARTKLVQREDVAEDPVTVADYAKLIQQALAAKNYRLAIRYHYLQVLQKLNLKGAIQLAPDKTNYEYVSELTGKPYKKDFAKLTLHYEYAWYGEFDIDEQIYHTIQQNYQQFNTLL